MLQCGSPLSVQMEGSKMDTFWYCSAVCICSHIWKLCPGSDQRWIIYGSHYFVFCSVYRYLSFLFQEKGSIFISSGISVCLTRNNGIHLVLPSLILLFFFLVKGARKYALIVAVCVFACYLGVEKGVAPALGVAPGS